MTNAILRGKPDAGNPHVRFDGGEVASAKPRRGSLLYKQCVVAFAVAMCATVVFAGNAANPDAIELEPMPRPSLMQTNGFGNMMRTRRSFRMARGR